MLVNHSISVAEEIDQIGRAGSRFREHDLQTAVKVWTGRCIIVPHCFLGFDRSSKQTRLQHIFEKRRGIQSGTPDCLLACSGRTIWTELKVGNNKPTEEQYRIGQELLAAGHEWFWCSSVQAYAQELLHRRVPLKQAAVTYGLDADLKLAARWAAPKKVARRPNTGRSRVATSDFDWTPFDGPETQG